MDILVFLDSAFKYAMMQSKGLTNKSASEEIGIPYNTYQKWVNWRNTSKFPSDEYVHLIAKYIDWNVDDLFIAIQAAKHANSELQERYESLIDNKNLLFKKVLTKD